MRKQLVRGGHLVTLVFSEVGSRSHFWARVGMATRGQNGIHLNTRKSWVTSAHQATWYVWSSKPVEAEGASTLWLVPSDSKGILITGSFDGLGLRGNDSTPVIAENVLIPEHAMLGKDGHGFKIMLETVLPLFNVLQRLLESD